MANPDLLAGFDRVVVATGARYRGGTGKLVKFALRSGILPKGAARRFASSERVRDVFYYRLRRSTGGAARDRLSIGCSMEVIGDAFAPGKSEAAIVSAYRAAFGVDLLTAAA